MPFILERLKQPAAWRGLVMLATGLGVGISPEAIEVIVMLGASVSGLIGILSKPKQ